MLLACMGGRDADHRSQVPDQRDIYFDFQGDFVHHSGAVYVG